MPELPEVETVRRNLLQLIINKKIDKIEILDKNIPSKSPLDLNLLCGENILNIHRYGKYLFFEFNNYVLISHLRMEGKYYFYDENEDISSHPRIIFYFKDLTKLVYDDVRRFGTMELYKKEDVKTSKTILNIGKEPWEHSIDSLYNLLKNNPNYIKSALLDQHIISGIGNIYADEILFMSKISPYRKANTINKNEIKTILENSKIILEKAIEAGGSTIKSYHPGRNIDGKFQQQLNVYDNAKKPCPTCKTILLKSFIGGRGSTYCPKCQKVAKVIGIYGKIASGKSTFLSYFKNDKYPVFSADEEVADIYKNDKSFLGYCLYHFKEGILNQHGKISKEYIKQIVFNDPQKKKILEDYLWNAVYKRGEKFISNHRFNDLIILEVPLLFESKMDKICDYIVGIDASYDSQIRNLNNRNSKNVSMDLVLNSTSKFDKNIKKIDFLIHNNESLEDFYNQYIILKNKLLNI